MKKTLSSITDFQCEYELIDEKFCIYNIVVNNNPLSIQEKYYGICELFSLEQFFNEPNIKLLNELSLFIKNKNLCFIPLDFDLNSSLSSAENQLDDYAIYIIRSFQDKFSFNYEEFVSLLKENTHQIVHLIEDDYSSPHLLDLNNNLLYYQAELCLPYVSLEHDEIFHQKIVDLLSLQKKHQIFTPTSFDYWLYDYSENISQTILDGFISPKDLKPMIPEDTDYPSEHNLLALNNISSSLANDCFQIACKAYYSSNSETRFDNTFALTDALIFELSGANNILKLNFDAQIKKKIKYMNNSDMIYSNLKILLLDYKLNNQLSFKKTDHLKLKI